MEFSVLIFIHVHSQELGHVQNNFKLFFHHFLGISKKSFMKAEQKEIHRYMSLTPETLISIFKFFIIVSVNNIR